MTPSLGRIVLVPIDPKINNGSNTAVAIVTRVWSDTCINLKVITDSTGESQWRTSQTLADETKFAEAAAAGTGGCWIWPPRV